MSVRPSFLFLLLVVTGCDKRVPEDEILSGNVPIARKEWGGILLEFGSPRALPHLSERGWSHGETAPDGNTFRWAVEKTVSFAFTSDREGDVLAWLECEPFLYEGSPTQWVAVSLNGAAVTEVELRPVRESYPIELPLVRGENTVQMQFRYAGDPNRRSADRRRLAAAFYRFDVPPPGEAPVARRTGPFSWTEEGLRLPANGSLSFFVDVEGEARLRVAASGPGVTVTARSAETLLVDETVDEGVPLEQDVDFEGELEIGVKAEHEVWVFPELYVTPPPPAEREVDAVDAVDANVVLVFLDGANALRMSSSTTPVLTELAAKSVVFENAVSQAVYTIASIGSVLTSQYPERHQSVTFADKLRDDVVTFPGRLSDNGYRTAGFSGNAVASSTFGLDRGYDEFHHIWERDDYTGHGGSVLGAFRHWLAEAHGERFFAYVHFREPHFPYNPPPPYDSMFGPSEIFPDGVTDWSVIEAVNARAASGTPPAEDVVERVRTLYEGNYAYVDALIGELVRCLEEHDLDEDTVLIVTADHGEALFEHGYIGHNTQLYEESVRVPLLLKIPGESPRRVVEVVELIDLAPTILELAGIPVPETMQGESLFDPDPERLAFTRTVWKRPRYSTRNHRFKLIWDSRTGRSELYDLEADPGEIRNLYDPHGFVSGYLEQRLLGWLRRQEALRGRAGSAVVSDEELRRLEALGYADVVNEER